MGLENFKDFVKNPYCDSYDTISDAQPEGQGHSINVRDILL